jgi:phosphate ABC transporter permease subunit PstA
MEAEQKPKPAVVRKKRVQKGEPYVWLSGGAIMTGILMIVAILALIVFEGSSTFWPREYEVVSLGQARFYIVSEDGKPALLDDSDTLVSESAPKARKATIGDFRLDPKAFAGRRWQLKDSKGETLKDPAGNPVTPAEFIGRPDLFPSPYKIANEAGKLVTAEKFYADDSLRDRVLILGSVRSARDLDLRDLPRKRDGSAWQAYELARDPEELSLRQGNKGENLAADSEYFRWVKNDVPDVDAYRRLNPTGYEACVLSRNDVHFACEIERLEKGVLCGYVVEVRHGEKVLATLERDGLARTWQIFLEQQAIAFNKYKEREEVEKDDIGAVNADMKELELEIAKVKYSHRKSGEVITALEKLNEAYTAWARREPPGKLELKESEFASQREAWRKTLDAALEAWAKEISVYKVSESQHEDLALARGYAEKRADLQSGPYAELRWKVNKLVAEEKSASYTLQTLDGKRATLPTSQVVRATLPNELGFFGKLGVYFARCFEFLWDNPREANTEGGIFPVIIGTLLMTLLMCIAVVPFGVIAALYLREYAKQGPVVSAVRIAVNNLAGVPSIVFGIFGLGFFCVIMGGTLDSFRYPERLPSPTFGGGGIMWASFTLALMTVPVVIVATEEALLAVPSSQREASLACGASRFQTVWRVILPQAMPGILTGMILAMARGAGEVAPLMLVGAVKKAETLPVDGYAPFVHLERKFMHLGFHIYDVGFQSPDADSTKPLVFTTTLVLLLLVAVLNIAAIRLRNKLRKRLASSHV